MLAYEDRNNARFQLFFRCKHKPMSQIQVPSPVTNRANPRTGPSSAIFAAALLWLALGSAAYSQTATPSSPMPTGEWLVNDRVARVTLVACGGRLWGGGAWKPGPAGTP